ncbi:MAG: MoaD/ThiS family protein [Lentisphaeria bacterium]|nr:MoaD/ThiS family protein [Lentisphaeria bacterium]
MTYQLLYFAMFQDWAGKNEEQFSSAAATPAALYEELCKKYSINYPQRQLRVAVNDQFANWEQPLNDGDRIAFIPPVAGG